MRPSTQACRHSDGAAGRWHHGGLHPILEAEGPRQLELCIRVRQKVHHRADRGHLPQQPLERDEPDVWR